MRRPVFNKPAFFAEIVMAPFCDLLQDGST